MTDEARQRLLERLLRGEATAPAEPTGPPAEPTGPPAEPPEVSTRDGPAAPLSFGQQRLWFLDGIDPTGSEYVTPIVLRLTGALDTAALAAALHRVVRRHEVLRSRIRLRGDTPVQETIEAPDWTVPVTDLAMVDPSERVEAARRRAVVVVNRPFDLARGPLLRTELIRLGREHWWLVIAVHHIAFDGWSRGIVLRDLAAGYDPALARAATLPEPPRAPGYADYAIAQRHRIASGLLDTHLDYWRARLAGAVPLDLPTVHSRPAVRDPRGALAVARLAPDLTAAVGDVAARFSATQFMVQLAAYLVLLGRYSGQRDFAVAVPSAGRGDPAWHGVVGFFVNTLPIRVRLDDGEPFAGLLRRVRDTVLDAVAHEEVPFEHLVDLVGAPRDPSRPPLCQVMFVQEEPAGTQLPQLAGLAVEEVEFDRGVARFDLTLAVRPDPAGGADVAVQYATSLFDAPFAERLLRQWEHLLRQLVTDPSAPVGQAETLTAAERARLLRDAVGPSVRYDTQRVEELVAEQVRRTPDAVAVRFDGAELTFAELDRESDELAARLRAAGAGPSTVVGVQQGRSLRLPVSVIAVLKAGAAYLPLEPDLPSARRELLCRDARARMVLTDDPDGVKVLDHDPGPRHSLDDLAYVIYTSGSTGTPKAVANTHGGLVNRLGWMPRQLDVGPSATILHKTPIGFDVSVWELLLPLVTGARMVIARPGGHLEPAYLAQLMSRERVTIVHFVPSMLRTFLAGEYPDDLSRLRHVICSGEKLDVALAARCRERLPGAALHNYYGPTEASIDVTAHEYECTPEHESVPIGRPVDNTGTYVVDERLRLVPPGAAGELLLGGVQLARGYLSRPALTAERFVPDPFGGTPGARLYRTGDLVRSTADGALVYLRRLDRQVKLRGMRVEPGELEAALLALPEIGAAVADVRMGAGGEPALVAWIAPVPGDTAPDEERVRAALRATLPGYLLPTALVVLPDLPVTTNGKVDLAALSAPSPVAGRRPSRPARGMVERTLARIWAETLGLPEVGVTDNFFDLGGNSLLAVLVTVRIGQELHRSLPVGMLMQRPTIAELATAVGDESALHGYGNLVPLRAAGRRRPMHFVHSHGGHVFVYQQVTHYLSTDRPVYALRARGLDDDAAPFDNLEEMAAHYAELIRGVQPHGPYALGGWCLGGGVAFEMAQQLTAAGEEVDLLAVISFSAVQEMPDWEANDDAAFLGFVLAGYLPDAGDFDGLAEHENVPLDLDRMRHLGLDDQLRYVMREAAAHNSLRPDVESLPEARRLFGVYAAHRKAILDYQMKPYDGRIVLFKAEANHLPDSPAGDLGWGRLARGGLTVHHIPGNHFELLQEPSVRFLAAALESHL